MSATASMKQSYLVFDKMPSTGKTEIYGAPGNDALKRIPGSSQTA